MLKKPIIGDQIPFRSLFVLSVLCLTGFALSGCAFSLDTETKVITSSVSAPSVPLPGGYQVGLQNEEFQIFISIASEGDSYFADLLFFNKEKTTLFPRHIFINPLGDKWFAVSGDAISPDPHKSQYHSLVRIGKDIETILLIQKLPVEKLRKLAGHHGIKINKNSSGDFSVVGQVTEKHLIDYLKGVARHAGREQMLLVQRIERIPQTVINSGFTMFVDPLLVNNESDLKKLGLSPVFLTYLKSVDQRGIPWGAFLLSRFFLHGWGVENDYGLAGKYANRSIQLGLEYGKATLGDLALSGYGQPGGIQFALKMFHEAAESGHPAAAAFLGDIYRKGDGAEKNQAEAIRWYLLAAEKGDATSQFHLGFRYFKGEGVTQDDREAVNWFLKAADQGHAPAQVSLGVMYEDGRGVPQDYQEAVKWYRKAADQGHASAQLNLGIMHYLGKGVEKDTLEAAKWLRSSAMQGNASAQYVLATLYQGLDPAQSYAWRIVAANNNHKKAQSSLQEQKASLSLSQIEQAQRIVEEIKRKIRKAQ